MAGKEMLPLIINYLMLHLILQAQSSWSFSFCICFKI